MGARGSSQGLGNCVKAGSRRPAISDTPVRSRRRICWATWLCASVIESNGIRSHSASLTAGKRTSISRREYRRGWDLKEITGSAAYNV